MNYRQVSSFLSRTYSAPLTISKKDLERTERWLSSWQSWAYPALLAAVAFVATCVFLVLALKSGDVFLTGGSMLCLLVAFLSGLYLDNRVSIKEQSAVLSNQGFHACKQALDVCSASSEARNIRDALLSDGEPLRKMHLAYMERVATKDVCKKLHGIAA